MEKKKGRYIKANILRKKEVKPTKVIEPANVRKKSVNKIEKSKQKLDWKETEKKGEVEIKNMLEKNKMERLK